MNAQIFTKNLPNPSYSYSQDLTPLFLKKKKEKKKKKGPKLKLVQPLLKVNNVTKVEAKIL